METWKHGSMEHGEIETQEWRQGDMKRKTEAQVIFLIQFTVSSSCKRKFVAYPFVGKESKGNYPLETDLPIYVICPTHQCSLNNGSAFGTVEVCFAF
jgi:hypothetical protein